MSIVSLFCEIDDFFLAYERRVARQCLPEVLPIETRVGLLFLPLDLNFEFYMDCVFPMCNLLFPIHQIFLYFFDAL